MEKYTTNGYISKGGTLLLRHGASDLERFLLENKGSNIIYTFMVFKDPTALQFGYYHGRIVADFQQAFKQLGEHLTPVMCEQKLRTITTTCHERVFEEGKWIDIILPVESLSRERFCEYIDELKQVAAEELHFQIKDIKDLFKKE
ncbi:MAG: hypothetical protein ACOYMF_06125 [Bacteroidales bacterium]